MDDLIGKKIKLIVTPREFEAFGKVYKSESYDIDETDELYTQIKEAHADVRFMIPGWCYTQEHIIGRFNVIIEKDGTISRTRYG